MISPNGFCCKCSYNLVFLPGTFFLWILLQISRFTPLYKSLPIVYFSCPFTQFVLGRCENLFWKLITMTIQELYSQAAYYGIFDFLIVLFLASGCTRKAWMEKKTLSHSPESHHFWNKTAYFFVHLCKLHKI